MVVPPPRYSEFSAAAPFLGSGRGLEPRWQFNATFLMFTFTRKGSTRWGFGPSRGSLHSSSLTSLHPPPWPSFKVPWRGTKVLWPQPPIKAALPIWMRVLFLSPVPDEWKPFYHCFKLVMLCKAHGSDCLRPILVGSRWRKAWTAALSRKWAAEVIP